MTRFESSLNSMVRFYTMKDMKSMKILQTHLLFLR